MIETIKQQAKRSILGDQSGQDTIEYVAIGGLVIAAIIIVIALIRAQLISGANRITW
jgi:Flp pilus assembly pilin Flp